MRDNADRRIELATELVSYDETYADRYVEIKQLWKEFFDITLRDLGIKDQESIDVLFFKWDMQNWNAMHRENTEYKYAPRKELYNSFSGEADYIADRISLDRIFRTHWLYRQVFGDEIMQDIYPGRYKEVNTK